MELKTKVNAEDGKQELVITREFDLPVELLFKAYEDPEIVEQWMTSKVIKLESKKNGSYQLEKADDKGNVVFQANGVIHEFIPNRKITRTFEMSNTPYGVQLEIYESVEQRDQVLQLPFAQGLNWAHNRIQEVLSKLK